MRTKSEAACFPRLRREFATLEEMGEVINRSKSYVAARMVGKQSFTHKEKTMILNHIGKPDSVDIYFQEE